MAKPIKIGLEQRTDIEAVARVSKATLIKIRDELQESTTPEIRPSAFRSVLERNGLSSDDAKSLYRLLVFAVSLSVRTDAPVSLDRMVAGARLDKDLPTETKEHFSDIAEIVSSIASTSSVKLLAKSMALGYDNSSLLTDARIISDIRPVYDDERATIIGAILVQTLRLDYFRLNQFETISIALDLDDIRKLKKRCEDALRKVEVAREFATTGVGPSVFAVGEETHDPD